MRVKVHGPMSTYAPHPSGGGQVMTSWGPAQIVDVNDKDEASVEFYNRLIEYGRAEMVDEDGNAVLVEDWTPPSRSAPPVSEPPPATVEEESLPEAGSVEPDEAPDYDSWTLNELHTEIDRRNDAGAELKVSGNKSDLAARLREHDLATQTTS